MTADDRTVADRANGGAWRSFVGGGVAAVVAAAMAAGLLRVGAPLLLPFVVAAAAAIGAWVLGKRAVAVGVVAGTLAWSAFIVVALLAMGDAMEGFN